MYLYHYYDKAVGPFVNLSDIPMDEAKAVLEGIKGSKPNTQSAQRDPGYVERRHYYEGILREEFLKKGGVIKRNAPHYMVVEHSPWLETWYENAGIIKIPISEFDLKTVSFTYGDSHPMFSSGTHKMDDMEFRRKLYTYDEILKIIEKYGLPQDWNNDGRFGPSRYVEAHVWSDETVSRYK